ncbi:MAG: class I SAM-dependent methyltransferase [Candidatus Omnitrophota bacterium]
MSEELHGFDKAAAFWDTPPRLKLAREVARAIVRYVALTPSMDMLDFGCGTGNLALALRPKVRSVTGADASKVMLDVFKEKIHREGVARVRTLFIDQDHAGPIPGKYHFIAVNMALHHVKDTGFLLKRLYDALHSGGILSVTDLDPEQGRFHDDHQGVHHHGFDRAALRAQFIEAGFADLRDHPAAEMSKPDADGKKRKFTIFIMTGLRG